jgi:hypothetical protein
VVKVHAIPGRPLCVTASENVPREGWTAGIGGNGNGNGFACIGNVSCTVYRCTLTTFRLISGEDYSSDLGTYIPGNVSPVPR